MIPSQIIELLNINDSDKSEIKAHVNNTSIVINDKARNLQIKFFIEQLLGKKLNLIKYNTLKQKESLHNKLWKGLSSGIGLSDKSIIEKSGFATKNYAEYMIHSYNFYDGTEMLLTEFKIGPIEIGIWEEPSELFQTIFYNFTKNEAFSEWTHNYVIRLAGVTLENYKQYIAKAFYIFNKYNNSFQKSFPSFATYLEDDEYELDKIPKLPINNSFKDLKHEIAISYFNEGESSRDDISFLYYYKVLEYFFYRINLKFIKKEVELYNRKQIDEFELLDNLKSKAREEDLLNLLLIEICKNTNIVNTCSKNNIINNSKIETLGKHIYKTRNAIAHGKENESYKIVPMHLNQINPLLLKTMRRLAKICINKYC